MEKYFYQVVFNNGGKQFRHIYHSVNVARRDKERLIEAGCQDIKIQVYKAELIEEV